MGKFHHLKMLWLPAQVFNQADLPACPPFAHVASLGLREEPMESECGLNPITSTVIASGLTSVRNTAFIDIFLGDPLEKGVWRNTPGGKLYTCSPKSTSLADRLRRRNTSIPLMKTGDASILATLCLSEGGWVQQQQVILMTNDDQVIEGLSPEMIVSCLGAQAKPAFNELFEKGVEAVILAGHDGGWAAIYAVSMEVIEECRNALMQACTTIEGTWQEASTIEQFLEAQSKND